MKKLTSAELFRIPSNDFYIFIKGNDFYSSGIFTVKHNYLNPGNSFRSKGVDFNNDGLAVALENKGNSSVFNYDLSFEQLIETSMEKDFILYEVSLSNFTRQGVVYASYKTGFIALPAKIIEFILKNISNVNKLYTNGKTLYVKKNDEIVAMVETCKEPALSDQEKEIIIELSAKGIE